MRKILLIFFAILGAFASENRILIVEFDTFREAQNICNGSDWTKIPCLVENLRSYGNKIYTKYSAQDSKIMVLFYAIKNDGTLSYPQFEPDDKVAKFCEFRDSFGKISRSNLSGNGFSYALNYHFSASTSKSKAYISCHLLHNNKRISQISQPITVIPSDFDLNLSIKSAQDSLINLNYELISSPNISQMQAQDYTNINDIDFALSAGTHIININANALARTQNGDIDRGFSGDLRVVSIRFNRDNGLCNAIGESANGGFSFKNGKYLNNNIKIDFLDVASGELELILGHNLDSDDRANGKCLNEIPQSKNITNAGKIPCQKYIVIKKRIDIIPHAFYASFDTRGSMIYYNQHTYINAISFLPSANIELVALNARNAMLKNFNNNCYAKDLFLKLDDNKNNLLFINQNAPDSALSKENFTENSRAKFMRQISSSGIKDRDLTPMDAFNSNILNLNDSWLFASFNLGDKYPVYKIKPKFINAWRIAILRGRIALIPHTNTNANLIINPHINFEFYCKAPTCKIQDFESLLSPRVRFAKSNTDFYQSKEQSWYINSAHPSNFKVESSQLNLSEGLSVYSLGSVVNGIQTLALNADKKGDFSIGVKQDNKDGDFANFLYFAPNYINVRENLATSINFSIK